MEKKGSLSLREQLVVHNYKKSNYHEVTAMSEQRYLIDIERFVRWTYDNPKLFNGENSVYSKSAVKEWRRYESSPSKKIIEEINSNYLNGEKPFERINIDELILCVNNAKDHNGRLMKIDRSSIESTGKKVMIFLLLAGYVEERDKGGALACSRTKFSEVHSYLSKKKSNKMEIDTFYYIPGRCVSLKQLCEANKRYKNHITDSGMLEGLKYLEDSGLVICVDRENKLYKISFEGCKSFVNKNTQWTD